jgi:hypothetical protein
MATLEDGGALRPMRTTPPGMQARKVRMVRKHDF